MYFTFQSIASVYTGLMQGVGAAEKVFEYLDREPKHPANGAEAPETCTGLVEFKDVTFAYPTRPKTDILKVRSGKLPCLLPLVRQLLFHSDLCDLGAC